MALYQKYRPTTLDGIKGNDEMLSTLDSMLSNLKSCPHVFLLTGPSGCGKTTIARIIAKRLEIYEHDLREIDSAHFRGIDSIREIRKQSQYKSMGGDRSMWLMDEIHKLSNDAQNALLKILEDPPPHVYFVLCTTDPQKLIKTIKSRCSIFQVSLLTERETMGMLRKIVKAEDEVLEREIYQQIAEDSFGHARNAINILEQVLASKPDERLQVAKKSTEEQRESIELCKALMRRAAWKEVKLILKGLKGQDPENIRRMVLGYCSAVLLDKDNEMAGRIMESFLEPFYNSLFPGLLYACYDITKN